MTAAKSIWRETLPCRPFLWSARLFFLSEAAETSRETGLGPSLHGSMTALEGKWRGYKQRAGQDNHLAPPYLTVAPPGFEPRLKEPESSVLPLYYRAKKLKVVPQGFEPCLREPKSPVLPLYYGTILAKLRLRLPHAKEFVAPPGFEPRLKEPESSVLPLYYRAIIQFKVVTTTAAPVGMTMQN